MTVQAWLDSERDYEVGLSLYQQLGDSERLKQVLASGDGHYNREALAWELTKLAKTPLGQVSEVIVTSTVTAPAAVVENATESLQSELLLIPAHAPLLLELLAARRPLYDERTQVHGQLEVLAEHATQEDVRLAAVRIMQLSRELNANWKTDAYVREHGQLPPAPAAAPGLDTLSPADLLKKRNNLRSQVSKLRKLPHRADDLVQAQTTLNAVEALLRHE
jgi:hypothetical protein